MDRKNLDPERLEILIAAHLENDATPAEQAELEALLLIDEAARAIFWRRAEFQHLLREAMERRSVLAEQRESRWRRIRNIFHPLTLAAAITVAVAGVAIWQFWARQGQQPQQQIANHETTSSGPVAYLTRTVGVVWLQPNARPDQPRQEPESSGRQPIREPLAAGHRLQLASGLVEIEYATGAKVILQGPAEFVVGGAREQGKGDSGQGTNPKSEIRNQKLEIRNSGFLASGKLTAHVPPAAKGFSVFSPTATVTDLGTEFAVAVELDPAAALPPTEIHVLTGKVQVTSSSLQSTIHNPQSTILQAGQSLRIVAGSKQGEVTTTSQPSAPDQFVRELEGPAGRVVFAENFEAMFRDEQIAKFNGWEQLYLNPRPVQLIFAQRAEDSSPIWFGNRVLHFWDEDPGRNVANPFVFRPLPPDAQGRPLTIRFDFRTLTAGAAPMFGIGDRRWHLRLAPELSIAGQTSVANVDSNRWYRLTLDIPAASDAPTQLGLRLEKLVDGRFVEPKSGRLNLPLKPAAKDKKPAESGDESVYFGFVPSEVQAVGGTWQLDNLEIRVK